MSKKVIKVKNALEDTLLYSNKTYSQELLNKKEAQMNKLKLRVNLLERKVKLFKEQGIAEWNEEQVNDAFTET